MISAILISLLATSGIWLDVPFVRQPDKGCGSAVVWMVLQYWSGTKDNTEQAPTLEEIHSSIYSDKMGGVSTTDMERFFRSLNYETYSFRGEWRDLEQHLSKGRPLIVCLQPGGRMAPLHYVTVTGVDRDHDIVLVNDPSGRKLQKVHRRDFERQWKLADNWTLLALPQ